jgi:archaemetzincin
MPEVAYYKPRARYKAPKMLVYLSKICGKDTTVIGLTDKDISHTTLTQFDSGIMGLGYRPGDASIVSTYRLKRKNLMTQFEKLCKHELGHTFGLPHCENKTCLMRDAKGKNHFDELKSFCPECKKHLTDRNWVLY